MFFRLSLALTLVLGFAGHVSAQDDGSVGLDDLPDCAQPCAKTAAAAVSCATTDVACLCSHSDFTSSTESCANQPGVCGVEDRSSVSGVLDEMCSSQNTSTSTTSSSAPAITSATSAGSSTTTSGKPSTASTSTSASAAPSTTTSHTETETDTTRPANTTPAATTPLAGPSDGTNTAVGGLTTPPTSGSTTVVVQTVVLPTTSDLTSGMLRAEGGTGVFVVLPVLLAVVGGLLL